MLDIVGSIFGLMAVGVNLVAITTALPLSLPQRLGLAGAFGAWVGLASGIGAAGLLQFAPERPPFIGMFAAFPLLLIGGWALAHSKFRQRLLGLPTFLLIGLNSLRILGALFLLLWMAGRLSGPFPFFAGLGDVITGAVAISLCLRAARGEPPSIGTIAGWNLFGALDLVVAVGLGITSANGPLQVFHVGVGSLAMQQLPYCLVPTVLVPFYLITHAIVAAQLAGNRRSRVARAG